MKTILTNARIIAGGDDLTGHANTVELTAEVDALDGTTFGSGGWRQRVAGLASTDVKIGGYLDAAAAALEPDAGVFAAIDAGRPIVLTVSPDPAVAYLVPGVVSSWAPRAASGAIAAWQMQARSDQALARGALLAAATVTEADTLPAVALPAVPEGKRLAIAVHATGGAGGAITVIVESAAAADPTFAAPTTRAEFEVSERGAQHLFVAGPLAAGLYRARLEVAGPTSFDVTVAAGVTT